MPLTGFMYAVSVGDEAAVRTGLESKTTCDENPAAVIIAAERGNLAILKLLVEQPDYFYINYKDARGNTPLVAAIHMERVEVVEYLVNQESIDLLLEGPRGLSPFSVALLVNTKFDIFFHLLNTRKITSEHLEAIFKIMPAPTFCAWFMKELLERLNEGSLTPSLNLLQHESIRYIARHSVNPELVEQLDNAIESLTPVTLIEERPLPEAPSARATQLVEEVFYVYKAEKHPTLIAQCLIEANRRGLRVPFSAFMYMYFMSDLTKKGDTLYAIAHSAAESKREEDAVLCLELIRKDEEVQNDRDLYDVMTALPTPYRLSLFTEFAEKLLLDFIAKLFCYEEIRARYLDLPRADSDNRASLIDCLVAEDDLASYRVFMNNAVPDDHLNLAISFGSIEIIKHFIDTIWHNGTRTSPDYTRWMSLVIERAIEHNQEDLVRELCRIEKYGKHAIKETAITEDLNLDNILLSQTLIRYGCDISKINREKIYQHPAFAALYIDTIGIADFKITQLYSKNIMSLAITKNLYKTDREHRLQLISYFSCTAIIIFSLALCLTGDGINEGNVFGVTLLHHAMGRINVFEQHRRDEHAIVPEGLSLSRFLIQCGAKLDVVCIDGCTPYTIAAWSKDAEAMRLTRTSVSTKKEYSVSDKNSVKLFQEACDAGAVYLIWAYWNGATLQEERKFALLYVIASTCIDETLRLNLVKALVAYGAEDKQPVSYIKNFDDSFHSFANKWFDYYLLNFEARKSFARLSELKREVNFLHSSDSLYLLDAFIFGHTALSVAVQRNFTLIVETLLTSEKCATVIHTPGYFLRELRYEGTDRSKQYLRSRWSPLVIAIQQGNMQIVKLLTEKSAPISPIIFAYWFAAPNKEEMLKYLLACLDERRLSVEGHVNASIYCACRGQYADYAMLELAVSDASFHVVETLLGRGANYSPKVLTQAFQFRAHEPKIIIILLSFMTEKELSGDPAKKLSGDPAEAQVMKFNWREQLLNLYKEPDNRPLIKQILIATQTSGTAFSVLESSTKCEKASSIAFDKMRQDLFKDDSFSLVSRTSGGFWGGGGAAAVAVVETPEAIQRKQIADATLADKDGVCSSALQKAIEENDTRLLEVVLSEIARIIGICVMGKARGDTKLASLQTRLEALASAEGLSNALLEAAKIGCCAVIQLLLKRKANINYAKEDGMTALHLAAQRGHTDAVRLLLKRGADDTLKSSAGHTYLEVASAEWREDFIWDSRDTEVTEGPATVVAGMSLN